MSRMKTERAESMTVTARVDEDPKEGRTNAFDGSIGDDAQSHMGEVVRTVRGEFDNNLPGDEILWGGYLALRRTTEAHNPSGRRTDVTTVISKVVERAGTPKDTVCHHVPKPLVQDGYVELDWGEVTIYQPEKVNASVNRASPTKGKSTGG